MGVYAKSMRMPKSCWNCTLYKMVDCAISLGEESSSNFRDIRHPNCPLTEISEPHGQLVDRDKLFDDEKLCYGVACRECQFLYETENFLESCCKVERMIYNTPTVIEGSKR